MYPKLITVYAMTHGPKCIWLPKYCKKLEIGAACRETHCSDLRDDNNIDNISKKDKTYCELTGLYWIWKNNTSTYTGLYHYGRVFYQSEKKIKKYLKEADWIVAKPWVMLNTSIDEEYAKDHINDDWVILKETLKEIYPSYYNSSITIFSNNKIYPCNMFITSQKKVNEYCQWLFPLLFAIEERINLNDGRSEYNKRVMGFLAERLFTLYLLHNNYSLKEVAIIGPSALSKKCPKILHKIANNNISLSNILCKIQEIINR